MRGPALLVAILLSLTACGAGDTSAIIERQLQSGGIVDLDAGVPGPWERVCILGPYSDNRAAAHALGFPWPVDDRSNIAESDAISLLLFVRGNEVLTAVEHPRSNGDFANLSGRCFPRAHARFSRQTPSGNGWPTLVPQAGP